MNHRLNASINLLAAYFFNHDEEHAPAIERRERDKINNREIQR